MSDKTPNIPDGLSMDDLLALHAGAPTEEDVKPQPSKGDGPYDGLSRGQLLDAIDKLIGDSMEICADPMFHKLIVMEIINRMILWHTECGQDENGMDQVYWLRDAGKLQGAACIIASISMGPDDFIAAARR